MTVEIVNQTAAWQSDVTCKQCNECHKNFSMLNRRHHCRCCGNIFCHNCSNKFVSYNMNKLKPVKRPDFGEDFPPYRTCKTCYNNLYHLGLLYNQRNRSHNNNARNKNANNNSNNNEDDSTYGSPINMVDNTTDEVQESTQETTGLRNGDTDNERNHCPICNIDFKTLGDEVDESMIENHIQICIEHAERAQQHIGSSGSNSHEPLSSPTSKNRMLVYKVPFPKNTNVEINEDDYEECPICFEAMLPGEKIGRLECLCVFHYHCIKSWFIKKSNKVAVTEGITHIGKNFCPLHDAII